LVVCAGAKAILDLTATREVLETQGIPVIGYQTDEFPAFYTRSSGLPVDMSVDTPEEAVQVAVAAWEAGLKSAVLLVVPPPQETALEAEKMESAIVTAIAEAVELNIQGSAMTPFLLNRVSELTDGESLQANLALLKNNAWIAGKAAAAMAGSRIIGPF
jgi:pseudouridine-5'-phosphate glycosidase